MSDTRMKTRIIQKHAIESDWAKAVNFTPLQGEIIIYDIDDNYDYERIKIGDGVQNVNDLPFAIVQPDWSVNDEASIAHIKNKPFGDVITATDISGTEYTIGEFTSGTLTVEHDAIPLEIGQVWSVQGTNDANVKTVSVQINDAGELYLGTPTVNEMPFYIRTTETTLNSSYWYQMQPSHLTLTCVSGVVTTASVKQLSQKYIPNADWNVNDDSADGYIKNRTHYDDSVIICDWDGDISKIDDIVYVDDTPVMYRIGDSLAYTAAEIQELYETVEPKIVVSSIHNYEFQSIDIMPADAEGGYGVDIYGFTGRDDSGNGATPVCLNILSDNFELEVLNVVVPKKGMWLIPTSDFTVLRFCFENIKTLDPKFLPNNGQSDWNQNDSTETDYIKNRTHYTEEVVKDIEYEININGEHNIPLELGQTYELWYTTTYNNEWVALTDSSTNEIITCEVKEDDNGLYVGDPNHSIWPTCVRTTNSTVMSQFISAYSIVSMKIATHITTTVVHQIDQKFVPNADWNVNDENANGYIKNRPFGDIFTEKEYIFERGDVTTASGTHAYELSCAGFDGNKLAVGEGYSVYYTTSFTSNPIVWAKLSPADGEKFIAKVDENGVIYIGDPAVNSDIFYISSQTCAVNYMWVNQFTYAKGVKLVGPFVEIKQIAPKYINDMYYDETVAESLLDNHTITGFAPNGNMYTVNTNTLFDIVEGDVYQITWDGVEYEAVGSLFEGILYVGEINAMLTGMLGDEYPFCFALFIDQFAVATSNTGESHTLSVKKLGVETHTIPEKYIPHTIVSDWNIDDSTAFGYIKNKPFYDTATYTLVSDNELNELLSDVTSTQNSENVFRVVINGVTYDNVPGTYGYMTAGYIGVGDKPSSSGWNTTDFGFYYSRQRDNANADWGLVVNPDILPDVDSSTAVVEVYLQHRKLKKLDPKYLPDDLVTVEYVDSKVVQSDWNQNDTTNTSYIKNRPFYAEREVVFENLNVAGNLLTPYVFDSALSLEDGAMYYASGVYSSSITNTPGDVSFDGTYKCVNGIITIFPYENSGEPVLSVLSDKIQIGVGNKQGNASVTFASLEKIVGYHTLDEKFIPDTIARVSEVEEVKNLIGDTSVSDQINTAIAAIKPKCTAITLPASNWTGDANPWSQVVTVNGVTSNSKVDLQPTAVQIVDLQNNEITLILQNDNGVVTAWAIGNKPTKDYTMQVLITEVVCV
jgi:hypothetical protein